MSFDDLMMVCLLVGGIGMFYTGLYKFSAFYHTRQLERAKEEFKQGLHKPHFFGDGS